MTQCHAGETNEADEQKWNMVAYHRDREKANPDDTEASLGGVQAKRLYEILLLGKDQRKALIEHCKGEAGFADAETFNAEIQEIVGIVKEKSSAVKNS